MEDRSPFGEASIDVVESIGGEGELLDRDLTLFWKRKCGELRLVARIRRLEVCEGHDRWSEEAGDAWRVWKVRVHLEGQGKGVPRYAVQDELPWEGPVHSLWEGGT